MPIIQVETSSFTTWQKKKTKNSEMSNRTVEAAQHMKKRKKAMRPAVSEDRFVLGFQILSRWLQLKQAGKSLVPFFKDNAIEHIAIYGMGTLGERLWEELRDSDIAIDYAIDRQAASKKKSGLRIYDPDEAVLPETGVVVVTPVQDYWIIVELLQEKMDAPIMSLRDVVDYCMDCLAGGWK